MPAELHTSTLHALPNQATFGLQTLRAVENLPSLPGPAVRDASHPSAVQAGTSPLVLKVTSYAVACFWAHCALSGKQELHKA